MSVVFILLVAAVVFGLCFAVDKLFSKLFRSRAQHRSGLAVRASKRYGAFGVILMVLGVAALIFGENLRVPGAAVLLMAVSMTSETEESRLRRVAFMVRRPAAAPMTVAITMGRMAVRQPNHAARFRPAPRESIKPMVRRWRFTNSA